MLGRRVGFQNLDLALKRFLQLAKKGGGSISSGFFSAGTGFSAAGFAGLGGLARTAAGSAEPGASTAYRIAFKG